MNNYSTRVAIVGVTGYAGQELDRLLNAHPHFRVTGRFASKTDEASGVEAFSVEKLRQHSPDAVVLATEHEFSLHIVPELLSGGLRVVDVWESRESFETFVRDRLGPVLQRYNVPPPRIEYLPLLNGYTPAGPLG